MSFTPEQFDELTERIRRNKLAGQQRLQAIPAPRTPEGTRDPVDEPGSGERHLGEVSVQEAGTAGFFIRITSRRVKLCDLDNLLFVKPLVDCLRYAGVIADDNPRIVRGIEVQQEKVKGHQAETIIEVFQVD